MNYNVLTKKIIFINPFLYIFLFFTFSIFKPNYQSVNEINYFIAKSFELVSMYLWFGLLVVISNYISKLHPNRWNKKINIAFILINISVIAIILAPVVGLVELNDLQQIKFKNTVYEYLLLPMLVFPILYILGTLPHIILSAENKGNYGKLETFGTFLQIFYLILTLYWIQKRLRKII